MVESIYKVFERARDSDEQVCSEDGSLRAEIKNELRNDLVVHQCEKVGVLRP